MSPPDVCRNAIGNGLKFQWERPARQRNLHIRLQAPERCWWVAGLGLQTGWSLWVVKREGQEDLTQLLNHRQVRVVDVPIHAEQPPEDAFDGRLRKRKGKGLCQTQGEHLCTPRATELPCGQFGVPLPSLRTPLYLEKGDLRARTACTAFPKGCARRTVTMAEGDHGQSHTKATTAVAIHVAPTKP